MKWIFIFVTTGFVAWVSPSAYADSPPTFRQQHPLAWMHGLPAGELPGWSRPWWINFEVALGNVWNAPTTMIDKRNGRQYQYMADFEQLNYILEFGRAVTDRVGVSVEIPYSDRNGGILDPFIDSFHLLIGNRRFNRVYYPKFQDIFSVQTNGTEYYSADRLGDGVSNIRLKLKYWFLKSGAKSQSSCPCGISISSQTKFPVQDEKYAGTTGSIDQSFLLNFGLPIFSASRMWFTVGYTLLGDYPAMKDWPRNKEIYLYESNFDFSLDSNWGIILSGRAESPFLQLKHLTYSDPSSDPDIVVRNRAASGWNGLVYWRGSESIGLRYRATGGNQIQFSIAEDWGIGPYDAIDDTYSTNAPDVNFILQTNFVW